MTRLRLRTLLLAIPVLAFVPLVHAAEPHPCTRQFNDAQRLACYDATFGKPVRPVESRAAAPVVAPAIPASAPVAAPVVVAPAAAAPVVAAPPSPAPEVTGTFVVTSVGQRSGGRFVVTLDNGLKWSQLEQDRTVIVKAGETVTIRRGALSSHQLVTGQGAVTKVQLLK